jgi:hypothetical protein
MGKCEELKTNSTTDSMRDHLSNKLSPPPTSASRCHLRRGRGPPNLYPPPSRCTKTLMSCRLSATTFCCLFVSYLLLTLTNIQHAQKISKREITIVLVCCKAALSFKQKPTTEDVVDDSVVLSRKNKLFLISICVVNA